MDGTDDNNSSSKVFKNRLVKKEMELKLVAEIKERADQKHGKNSKESPIDSILAVSGISHDPVSQLGKTLVLLALFATPFGPLVTELSQSLNMEREMTRKNSLGKCTLKKTHEEKSDKETNGVSFVTQLKKTDANKKLSTKEKCDVSDSGLIIDFKSRLRKVDEKCTKKDGKSLKLNPKK